MPICVAHTNFQMGDHWNFHCSLVNLPWAALFEKIDPPFPRSWHLPIDLQRGVRLWAQLPSPCWDLIWLGLTWILWFRHNSCEGMCVAAVYKTLFSCSHPLLSAVKLFTPALLQWSLSHWRREFNMLYSLLFSAPWLVVVFCVDDLHLQTEASIMGPMNTRIGH